MAGRWAVQRRCNQLNRERRVTPVKRYTFRQFWERSPGSFLITGGMERTRIRAICEKLCCEAEWGSAPSLVLTTSNMLEREMIDRIQAGVPGLLRVTSPDYRNYHFFYRWAPEDMIRFLVQSTQTLGYFREDVPIYARALIEILSCCYEPCLAALSALSAHTDGEIAQIGRRSGAPVLAVEQITRCAQAGQLFRLALHQISSALSPLSTDGCDTKYNLSALDPVEDGIYLVNIQSRYPELMAAYFSIELQLALHRIHRPRLVFSDLDFHQDGSLSQVLRNAQRRSAEVGVSTQNASALLGRDNENYPNRVILLDAGYADGDLETVLRPLGTYTHYETLLSGGKPAKLFPILSEEHWTLNAEPGRLRVRPLDVAGYRAVLCGGGSQEILLASYIE